MFWTDLKNKFLLLVFQSFYLSPVKTLHRLCNNIYTVILHIHLQTDMEALMKLKHKKVILFSMISTMSIGIITLAITPNYNFNFNNKAKESVNPKVIVEEADVSSTIEVTPALTLTPTQAITTTPTIAPTPASLPVFELEEGDLYPEITALFKSYYEAKLNCDVNLLKTLLSDVTNIASKKQLEENILFIEEYQKIKCYVKKGFEEGSYVVFVYTEVKFMNIKTPAPAVYQFYVVTDTEGNLKIFSGEFDTATKEYYEARKNDEDVLELISNTNDKVNKAKEKDEDLKNFWDNLENTD